MSEKYVIPRGLLVCAMAIWGSSFAVFKTVLTVYTPLQAMACRMTAASVFFLFFLPALKKVRVQRSDLPLLLLMALAEPCLYFLFESAALKLTTASAAGVISATLPLIVAVAGGIFLGEVISRGQLMGMALSGAGMILLTLTGSPDVHAPSPVAGNLLEAGAMFCAAAYTIVLKKLAGKFSALYLTAFQSFCGCVFFVPLMLLADGLPPVRADLPSFLILYLGVFVTVGGYGLYNYSTRYLPATQVALFTNLIPVFALLVAVIWLGERISVLQFAAAVLVVSGVVAGQYLSTGRRALTSL